MYKTIHAQNVSQEIRLYSQAIALDKLLLISGQIPADPQTREIISEISEATHQVMKNLDAILSEAGSDFSKVVKATIFLKDMDDFAVVNEIYASYFTDGVYPRSEERRVG